MVLATAIMYVKLRIPVDDASTALEGPGGRHIRTAVTHSFDKLSTFVSGVPRGRWGESHFQRVAELPKGDA